MADRKSAAKRGTARRVGNDTAPGRKVAGTVATRDAVRSGRAPSSGAARIAAAKKNTKPVFVKVVNPRGGWYDNKRQRYGDQFFYRLGEGELLPSWVVPITKDGILDPSIPVRVKPEAALAYHTDSAGRVITDLDDDSEDIEDLAADPDDLTDPDFTARGRHTIAALTDRSPAELVELAKSQYGLDLDPTLSVDRLIIAIAMAQEGSAGIAPGPKDPAQHPGTPKEEAGSGDGE